MTENSIVHDTFAIERSYLATPSRVFAAFGTAEARHTWTGLDGVAVADERGEHEMDFRVGGRERFGFISRGTTYRYDARYYDIVPDERIIYSYEMYAQDARMSVSVATIELVDDGDGTALVWTEQGAFFLDSVNGPHEARMRKEGTAELLGRLGSYLQSGTL